MFAIRNVCLGNHDNQAILYAIDKTGKMDKKLLEAVGVQIEDLWSNPATSCNALYA